MEKLYGIKKGHGFAGRKVKHIDQSSPDWQAEPEASFLDAKSNLMDAIHRHFFRCLPSFSKIRNHNHRIDNQDHLHLSKPLYDPRPPRVPERPEINGGYRGVLLSKVLNWKDAEPAIHDRRLFKQQLLADSPNEDASFGALTSGDSGVSIAELHDTENGILSEEKLIRIYLLLSDLLWYGQNTPVTQHVIHKLEVLLVLQRHFELAQALDMDPSFHPVQYVMAIRRYDLFAVQMLELGFWFRRQFEERNTDKRTHQFWTLVIENIYNELEHSKVSLNFWLNNFEQPKGFVEKVERLQDDTKEYRKAIKEWYASKKHVAQKEQRSYHSLSSRVSPSVSSLSLDDVPLVEEPEAMQPQRQNGRFRDPQKGKRARRNESTGSSCGSADRPPLRKKEKQGTDEGKGKGTKTEA